MRPYFLIFYHQANEGAPRLFVINPLCDFFAFVVKNKGCNDKVFNNLKNRKKKMAKKDRDETKRENAAEKSAMLPQQPQPQPAVVDSMSKKEKYYSYIENLSREVSQLNGVIQEENDSIRTMRQALRKLEKSYNDKSKELFETINIGIDNWTPPPIQQEFVECVNIPKNVGAKNLLPEPDGKTAATESKAERDAEWVYDDKKKKDKNLTIKEVDKHLHFVHKIFIHKMPNGEIDYQDMRMPGIVGEYAFDDMSWSERTTSEFKAFKEIIARKNYGMPEIYSHIKDETVGMLFDVFCELFEDDVFEKFHISEKRLKLYRQQLDSIFCGFWYDWYAMRERN